MTFKEKLIRATNRKAANTTKWKLNKAWALGIASTTFTGPLHNLEPIPNPWPLREIVLTGFLVVVLAVLLTLFIYVNP